LEGPNEGRQLCIKRRECFSLPGGKGPPIREDAESMLEKKVGTDPGEKTESFLGKFALHKRGVLRTCAFFNEGVSPFETMYYQGGCQKGKEGAKRRVGLDLLGSRDPGRLRGRKRGKPVKHKGTPSCRGRRMQT